MDHSLRLRARDHSPEGQAAWLRGRMHVESTMMVRCQCQSATWPNPNCPQCDGIRRQIFAWEYRIKLAAYCGHPGALILYPSSIIRPNWLNEIAGLYPEEAMEQAALAACEYAFHEKWLSWQLLPSIKMDSERRALNAARAYFDKPSAAHRWACMKTGMRRDSCLLLAWYIGACEHSLQDVISTCGDVEDVIKKRLIEWTIG